MFSFVFLLFSLLNIQIFSSFSSSSSSSSSSSFCLFEESYPQQYLTHKLSSSSSLIIDGKLNEIDWLEVPFTSSFIDISTSTIPKYLTKVKILWDDLFLYIGGYLEEEDIWSNITSTCHCNTSIDDQIIFHDNDFEIFLDPDGNNHFYKEYEMNSMNATWDLLLNKPYLNGGYENSSRIYGIEGFDMQPPLTSGVFIDGTLNNPQGKKDSFWTVEVAIPLLNLIYN